MRIVFIGAPGAGKGTQAQRLAERLNVPHLSTGEILREAVARKSNVGQIASEFLDRGDLVPDSVVVRLVGERLDEPDCARGCLFDGFPRTLAQAEALDELLASMQAPLDIALELAVRRELLVRRLLARGRSDDVESTIRQRLAAFELQTLPLLEYYKNRGLLRTVDGEGDVDEVFARVCGVVDEIRKQKNES
jgi:adenylate kinase